LHEFIKSKLADETSMIVTDDFNQYDGIADENTKHETVSHTQKEWVHGRSHGTLANLAYANTSIIVGSRWPFSYAKFVTLTMVLPCSSRR
jgi:hypothetical protein